MDEIYNDLENIMNNNIFTIDDNNINLNLKEFENYIFTKIPYNKHIPEKFKKNIFLIFYYLIYKTYKYLDNIIINFIIIILVIFFIDFYYNKVIQCIII